MPSTHKGISMKPKLRRMAVVSLIALTVLIGAALLFHAAHPDPGLTPSAAGELVDSSAKVGASAAINGPNAVVTLHIDAGWHVYANPPSAPYLIPVTVVAQRSGRTLDIQPLYPPGQDIGLHINGKTIRVYENGTRIALPGLSRLRDVRLQVKIQACADKGLCLPPATIVATTQ